MADNIAAFILGASDSWSLWQDSFS